MPSSNRSTQHAVAVAGDESDRRATPSPSSPTRGEHRLWRPVRASARDPRQEARDTVRVLPRARHRRRRRDDGRVTAESGSDARAGSFHREPPLLLGARTPDGSLSPVAPRRTAVAAMVRPADHSLPCDALHLSGVSYEGGVLPRGDAVKRLGVATLAAADRSPSDAAISLRSGIDRASGTHVQTCALLRGAGLGARYIVLFRLSLPRAYSSNRSA